MKLTSLKFFSPKENIKPTIEKKISKPTILKGYISAAGKLVFPDKIVNKLGFDPSNTYFKIGTQTGKRKLSFLYLVPAASDDSDIFQMTKAAKSYSIPLGIILQSGGIDYATTKYNFIINTFEYEGVTAYELQLLKESVEKPTYTGKPRGRKRKNAEQQ